MSLIKYQPSNVSNWFDEFFTDRRNYSPKGFHKHFPAVEIEEKDDQYNLIAELPGVSKDDISISVENGILTLKGEKKSERNEEEKGYFYSERSYGSWKR